MSLMTEAVRKAAAEKARQNSPLPDPRPRDRGASFLAAWVIFIVMGAAGAALYVYEESTVSDLRNLLAATEAPLRLLKNENTLLTKEKSQLETRLQDQKTQSDRKIDELLGKARVLQYEKETIEADMAAKEGKINELQTQIDQQEQRETQLMTLLEQVKQQLLASRAPAAETVPAPAAYPSGSLLPASQAFSAPAVSSASPVSSSPSSDAGGTYSTST